MNNKGKVGNDTSVIITGIKKDRIKSNCWKCIYRTRIKGMRNDEMYCSYYKESNPKRNTCARYEQAKPYGRRIKKPKDNNCKNIKWKDLQRILLKDEGNLQKFEEKFCAGCKQNADGDCRRFGRKIDDLTKFPTEIEKWK